jgi:pyruvate/2-oxoglutarate dehydrogenase complex dihydrolipoamide dehydrogenase (E3) component
MSEQEIPSEVDVIVIGMGIGGEAVAGKIAEAGLAVIGIESDLVGGECPYWGCIPSKMMIRAANLLADARRIEGIAGKAEVTPDWGPVAQRIREQATDTWNDQVAVDRFVDKGGLFIRGRGRLTGQKTVEVDGDTYTARLGVVVAAGTSPAVPPIPGLADVEYWTNREIMQVEELPKSLIVLGSGAIGSELAEVFRRFGVEVSIIEALDRLLPREEPEVGELMAEVFESEGIAVHVGAMATSVAQDGDQIVVTLDNGTEVRGERILVATGRRTNVEGLGLDTVGVELDSPYIDIDDHMQVSDGLWAVGDITGKGLFTHIAAYQAPIATASILGEEHAPADYRAMPRVTFTDPEVGSVGLTEQDARDAGLNIAVATQNVQWTARGWLHATGNEGAIKLVIDADRDVLVGATSVGPHGGEVLSMLTLAVHAEIPVSVLKSMIYAYPSFHRGVEDALGQL